MLQSHIVVTGGGINALGVLRALSKYKLTLLCDDKSKPAWNSKFGNKILTSNTKELAFIEELAEYGKKIANKNTRPTLIITEEKTVFNASLLRGKLEPYFCLNLVEHPLLVKLQSKEGFQQIAEAFQSPVPHAVILKSDTQFEELDKLQFPCVFKPLEQNEKYGHQFKKAYKVNNIDEVKNLYKDICKVEPRMIVQEWLEGPDSQIYFCLAFCNIQHEIVSSFTGRKIRSWPIQVGGTASCTSAPEVEVELFQLTQDFVRKCSYSGLIGIEYKYDIHRKKFFMIEPTVGRTDMQHEIAFLSGQNYLEDMVLFINNQKIFNNKKSTKPVIWFEDTADANALANGAPDVLYKDRRKISAIFRWYDPMPFIHQQLIRFKRKFYA
jgi:D-aspartate ligase